MDRSSKPKVADKRRADFLSESREAARSFTPEWNPDADDAGAAVFGLFAEMAEGVAERWSQVPEKHRVAFFDALGFSREPAKPARLPLTFTIADGVQGNVAIPDGTRAVAEATDNRPEQTFEIADTEGFEATPAALRVVYSVNRATDSIFEHWTALQSGTGTRLFNGEDIQEHALYIGHNDVLNLKGGASVKIEIKANAGASNFEKLTWQYYGVGRKAKEEVVGWHDLVWEAGATRSSDGRIEFPLHVPPGGEIIEATLPEKANTESEVNTDEAPITELATRWIRAKTPQTNPSERLFVTNVDTVALTPITPLGGLIPDMLLYNDIPLPTDRNGASTVHLFGKTPRPLDAFYIASEEGFSKRGKEVTVEFEGWRIGSSEAGEDSDEEVTTDGGQQRDESSLEVSWEYWNGSGWDRIGGIGGLIGADDRSVTFEVPDDFSLTAVAGHDGYWIRARLLANRRLRYERVDGEDVWREVSEHVPYFSAVKIWYAGESQSEPAEHLVTDNNREYRKHDVTVGREGGFRPFTSVRDEKQTLYLGFNGELDKGPIQVLFSATDTEFPETFYPRAQWEYCEDPENDAWTKLSVRDGTESLTRPGIVSLVFADPTTAFERFGRELHWIRARLIGDEFDSSLDDTEGASDLPSVVITDIDAGLVAIENRGREPVNLSGYRVDFGYESSDDHDQDQLPVLSPGTVIQPDDSIVVTTETESKDSASAMFDERISEGNTVAVLTPDGDFITRTVNIFNERSEIAAVSDPTRTVDASLDPQQGVETKGENASNDRAIDSVENRPIPETPYEVLEALELATGPEQTTVPLWIQGIHLNAGWADNVRTVAGEAVGSSNGSLDQEFTLANIPVIRETIWVDELPALSEEAREEIKEARPGNIEEITDAQGDLQRFWVRWTPVDDFFDSSVEARQYVLNATLGILQFGNGQRGRIPPRGTDNIRADYRTGGGIDGNVRTGTVTGLESPLPFIEAVINPSRGGGGVDAEPKTETLDRASKELRDRGKAVTKEDFERVAITASRGLARVRCIPGLDRTGTYRAGWVTLLLVPRSQEPKPVPSLEVIDRVVDQMDRRAPTTLISADSKRLVVRGPSYIAVSVRTTVQTTGIGSVSRVEQNLVETIQSFLHPLTGAPEGKGWDFGELPSFSDFYALLQKNDGVDYVEDLGLTFQGRDTSGQIKNVSRENEPRPRVPLDALVFSGSHEVIVKAERITDTETEARGEATTNPGINETE